MRSIVCATLTAIIILGGSSGAYAQRLGVEIDVDEPYYAQPAPRADSYYYRSDDDRPAVVVPIRPASCGEFRYWNGERCVDARLVPPNIR
jgi:hypothetical protein